MSRSDDGRARFGGALVLTLTLALTLPASILLFGPFVGRAEAIVLHWLLGVAAWAAWLAPTRRGAIAAALLTFAGGLAVTQVVDVSRVIGGPTLALLVAILIALVRNAIGPRTGWFRGLTAEVAIGFGAVALSQLLAGPSLIAAMAGLWGFWLVESLHPLVRGVTPRPARGPEANAFDQAASRLEDLLDEA